MLLKVLIVLIYSVSTIQCHVKIVEERRDHCVGAKLPLQSWEIKPYPFVVHVWSTRLDSQRSCIGIIVKKDTILIPNWCIRAGDGEKRGHIAIYAPKSSELMTNFSRSKRVNRYDEQFELILTSDDVRDILAPNGPNKTFASFIPYADILKLPKDVPSHLKPICFWSQDNPHAGNNTIQIFLAWRQNGDHTFLIQQKARRPIKKNESIESFAARYTRASDVMLSVDLDNDNALIFSRFLIKAYNSDEVIENTAA